MLEPSREIRDPGRVLTWSRPVMRRVLRVLLRAGACGGRSTAGGSCSAELGVFAALVTLIAEW